MKNISTAITSISLLVLLMGGTTAAYASTPSQTLSTTVTGGVTNLGNQHYSVNGGQVAFAAIAGLSIDPTTATLQYSINADQTGLNTKGSGNFVLTGKTIDGMSVSVIAQIIINSSVAAAAFPTGCSADCTSELPFFFLGTSNVQVTVAGTTQMLPETMQIESPYFNPFGAPIVLASTDNAIVIAATYTQGTILWTGTQVAGVMTGTLDSTPVSGQFSTNSGEYENLVAGTARDYGTISFTSMTPSSLNAKGFFIGGSTIPTNNTSDCSVLTGIPGTCTETGFQSNGQFIMSSNQTGLNSGDQVHSNDQGRHSAATPQQNSRISGSYSTTWGVPALDFSSSIAATVSKQ